MEPTPAVTTPASTPLVQPESVTPQATAPTQQAPTTQPQTPPAQSTTTTTSGRLHRVGSISIKAAQSNVSVVADQPQQPQRPLLDEEGLRQCWDAMLDAMKEELPKLSEQLKDKNLHMEQEDFFIIEVNNSFLESEIKPHLIRMLTYLRNRSGRPNLNCKTEVVYEEKEAVVYTPRDKYEVMLKSNPALDTFRVLFPEVDY